MDPITAVGFTAAVVQLVDVSLKVAQTVKDVRERGSSRDLADSDHIASHLSSLSDSVQTSLQLSSIHRSMSAEEKELLDIASRCNKCSQKLQEELANLKLKDGAKRTDQLKVVVKIVFRRSDITALQDKLEGFRRVLESRLLYRLR